MRSAGETFFTENVMPVMLKRGCALETCHSPSGFNDFRLRPGTVGFVSPVALHRNYEAALHEFMSLDSPDVRQSRLVKKNLFIKSSVGIEHRGGALLEGPGPDSTRPLPGGLRSRHRHRVLHARPNGTGIERQDHAAQVSPLAMGNVVPLAFVLRPAGRRRRRRVRQLPRRGRPAPGRRRHGRRRTGRGGRQFPQRPRSLHGSRPGAATWTSAGPSGAPTPPSWRSPCARAKAGGLDLWLLENPGAAGARCRKLTSDNGRREGPVRVHNFDPVFAPDGSLVFASTRRGSLTLKRMLPNADLYRVGPDLNFGNVDTVTVLSGSELAPAFMYNGQLTFTAEKASPSFYQLSGRRINWDLTDYHPLLGQRAQSDDTFGNARPSVGYQQATEIREGLDRNFLLILSDSGALGGGGALAVFNRSVGPFEEGRNDVPFLQAMVLPDAAASGRAGTRGVYRSPSSLPDGEILASYAANVTDPGARRSPL